MSSDKKYYRRYKYYKEMYQLQVLESKRLQTAIEGCRFLLSGSLESCRSHLPQSLLTSSPETPRTMKRKLSFADGQISSDSSIDIVNNSDKDEQELTKNEELQDNKKSNLNAGPRPKPAAGSALAPAYDPDETFFDGAIEKGEDKTQIDVSQKSKKEDNTEKCIIKTAEKKPQRKAVSPKGHICPTPRCPIHQPFFVSSKRELKLLSPKTRLMARTKRGKSPPGYWSLELPSTQFIRTRNQSAD